MAEAPGTEEVEGWQQALGSPIGGGTLNAELKPVAESQSNLRKQ
jgi:hypothetical protein